MSVGACFGSRKDGFVREGDELTSRIHTLESSNEGTPPNRYVSGSMLPFPPIQIVAPSPRGGQCQGVRY